MTLERVRTQFTTQIEHGAFPGGQLCVRQRGRVVMNEAAGVARGLRTDEGQPVPVTLDTPFQIMSASKPVIAAAALRAVERGLVDLDAPVSRYMPEWNTRGKDDITVRDVLRHRSGVPSCAADDRPALWSDPSALQTALAEAPVRHPRGTLAYQELTFGLTLAEVITRTSGLSLGDFMSSEWGASCADLHLRLPEALRESRARTYWQGGARMMVAGHNVADGFEDVHNNITSLTAVVPGAGMYTTAHALAAFFDTLVFARATASGRPLLGDGARATLLARAHLGWDRSVGMPLLMGHGVAWGHRLTPHIFGWWHTHTCAGHGGGFGSVVFADVSHELTVAIVTNGHRSVTDMVRRFAPLGSAIRTTFT